MSKICQITGKKAQIGNNVSHSKHRTKRSFDVNLFSKKFYYVEEACWIQLKSDRRLSIMANKKAKGNRVQVILECTEMKESGLPGTSRYITTKNRKNTPERMELKKYNPILKRMTVHKEIK